MDVALNGIKNFLELINENWTTILVIIGLVIGIVKKLKDYMAKTDDEKVQIAKDEISSYILKLITDAEKDYASWNEAGQIKRAEVIAKIYNQYPILAKVVNQEELLSWIDTQIDSALVTLRDIMSKQETPKVVTQND